MWQKFKKWWAEYKEMVSVPISILTILTTIVLHFSISASDVYMAIVFIVMIPFSIWAIRQARKNLDVYRAKQAGRNEILQCDEDNRAILDYFGGAYFPFKDMLLEIQVQNRTHFQRRERFGLRKYSLICPHCYQAYNGEKHDLRKDFKWICSNETCKHEATNYGHGTYIRRNAEAMLRREIDKYERENNSKLFRKKTQK